MKKIENNQVVMNKVVNYSQAHTGARSMKKQASTLNQARKALSGIQTEAIVIGRDEEKKKIYSTAEMFMNEVGAPYSGGQITLASIKNAWAADLKDEDGNLLICKNVVKRVKVGKTSYTLYRLDENGDYKTVTCYEPSKVNDNGWDPYKICEGLAQSKFIEEVRAEIERSKAEFEFLKATDALYVLDPLTDDYRSIKVK